MNSSDPRAAPANPHARFIPREELEGFAAWRPHPFGDAPAARGTPPDPAQQAADAKAALQAARQSGYQDGYRDGLVALESFKASFAKQLSAQVGAVVAAFDAEFARLEVQIAASVAEAATALARQVVRSEITQRPEAVAAVAAEAVNSVLMSARHIRVSVHPDDHPLVVAGAADALAARNAQLLSDATVSRGGCRVESDLGRIDATIEARWSQAAMTLCEPKTPAGASAARGDGVDSGEVLIRHDVSRNASANRPSADRSDP
jgi:flagellar assembly protein FliH